MCRVICQTPVMLQSRKESVSLAHAVSCKENQATIWCSKCFGAVEANALQDKKNKALPPPGSFQTFRSSGCDTTNGVHAPVERPHSKLPPTMAPDISPGGLVMKLGGSGSRYSCHFFFLIVSAYRHTFTLPNPPPFSHCSVSCQPHILFCLKILCRTRQPSIKGVFILAVSR